MFYLIEKDDDGRKIIVLDAPTKDELNIKATEMRASYGEEPGPLFIIEGDLRPVNLVSVLVEDGEPRPVDEPATKPRTAISDADKARVIGTVRAKGPIGVNDIVIVTGIDGDTVSRILRGSDAVKSNGGKGRASKWMPVADTAAQS